MPPTPFDERTTQGRHVLPDDDPSLADPDNSEFFSSTFFSPTSSSETSSSETSSSETGPDAGAEPAGRELVINLTDLGGSTLTISPLDSASVRSGSVTDLRPSALRPTDLRSIDLRTPLPSNTSAAPTQLPATVDVPDRAAGDKRPQAASTHRQMPDQQRMAALLRLAQRGDGEAFGRIYDRYVAQVYRYLYYRIGSHAMAEDLTSETFLRALRRIDSFSWQGQDIGAWFITIARNLLNDHIKSSRFRLEIPTADMLDADYADDGIEQAVLDRLQGAVVLEAVRELKQDQQDCLVLRFLQGMSVAETARIMNRSEGAVKQLQLRAVRTLGRLLQRRTQIESQQGANHVAVEHNRVELTARAVATAGQRGDND